MGKKEAISVRVPEDLSALMKDHAPKFGGVSGLVRVAVEAYLRPGSAGQSDHAKEIKTLLADLSKQIAKINTAGSGASFNEAELLQKIQNRARTEIIESEKVLSESFNKQLAQAEARQASTTKAEIDELKTWLIKKFAG